MKKLLTKNLLLILLLFPVIGFGQAPEAFKYQAVIRDGGNLILTDQAVGMRLSIQQGSIGGTSVYNETFTSTSNGYGLVNLEIGTGISTDDFAMIDWANGPYFMETAVDITGGMTYEVMGTSQLMSVPYALYAKTSGNGEGPQGPTGAAGTAGAQGPAGQDGNDGVPGPQGLQGPAGADSTVPGPTGPAGADGINGQDGIDGAQGIQGPAGENGINGPNGIAGAQGPQGLTGPAGADGIDGIDGDDGAQGIQGNAGATGSDGQDGDDGITGQSAYDVWISLGNTGSEADFISSLTGPQGNDGVVDYDYLANIISIDSSFTANVSGSIGGGGSSGSGGNTATESFYYPDTDGDGYGGGNPVYSVNAPPGYVSDNTDCDDNDASINPNASEIYDGFDNNCDGQIDEGLLSIGDTLQGGIIFYLDGNGGGLIAANYVYNGEWGCTGIQVNGADGTAIGTGNQNTIDILSGGCLNPTAIAAGICDYLSLGGYSDWFLPSKYELNLLMLNLSQTSDIMNISGFTSGEYYWSSTEGMGEGFNYAWVVRPDGDMGTWNKDGNKLFIPIRAF